MKKSVLFFLLLTGFYLQAQICPTLSVNTKSIACNGSATGAATAVVSGGTLPYTYTWSPSGGILSIASGLSAGNYTLRVQDASTCAAVSVTFSINQPGPFIAVSSQTSPACWGGSGIGSFTAIGGTTPYTYTWLPIGGNASTATLSAGSYSLLIKDFNNCLIVPTFTMTEPPNLIANVSVTNAICGGTNGAVNVLVSGGTPGYSYTWTPGGASTASVHVTSSSLYTVNVRDANNCAISNTVLFTQTSQPSLAINISSISCYGANTGSVTVSVSGGLAPYTYSWSSGVSTSSVASGLAPGNYTLTVGDAVSCFITTTLSITQPSALTSNFTQNTITCNGGTGSASLNVSGGVAPYSYTWSPSGGNSPSATLTAGVYTVHVRDANQCSLTPTLNFIQPSPLTAIPSHTNILCFGTSNGAASISVSGGTSPYTYSWTPSGGSSASLSNLSAGNYTVTVKDNNLCSVTVTYTLTQGAQITASSNTQSVSCNGQSTGAATLNASGGTGTLSYSWTPSGGAGPIASGLPAGTYSVQVRDANNCTQTFSLSITQAPALTSTLQVTNITCNNSGDGSASLTVNGGTAPYTYSWNPGGASTPSVASLTGGTYTVLITDANFCVKTQTFQLVNPPQYTLSLQSHSIQCGGQSSGSATLSVSGGVPNYTYSWSPTSSTSSVVTNLASGNYTVTVTDANTCSTSRTLAINQPPALSASVGSSSATCTNADGSASLTVSGGTGVYSYSWSPVGGSAAVANNIPAGQYTVTVSDQNNCQLQSTVVVGAIIPSLGISISNPTICPGATTTLTASGANTYTWLPAAALSSTTGAAVIASPTIPATYSVIGTFSNGCIVTATVQVQLFPITLPSVSFSAASLCAGNSATLHASGAVNYTWSPASGLSNAFAGNPTLTLNNTTTYTVTAIDNIGCSTTETLLVNALPLPVITVSGDTTLCLGSSRTLSLSGAASYTWSSGANTSTLQISPTQNTVYVITATGTNNCITTKSIALTVNTLPTVSIQSPTLICKGNSVTLTASGASSYSWSNGGSGASVADTPSSSVIYSVTGKDQNYCVNTASFALQVFTTPTLNISGKKEICINEKVTLAATGASSYTWSTGDMTTSIAYTFSSNTVITVSSGAGTCVPGSASISISVDPTPSLSITQTVLSIYYGQSATLSAVSDATLNNWSPAAGLSCTNCLSPVAQPSASTIYTIESTKKSCKTTGQVLVEVDNFCGELFIPTAFSPNEDNNNDTWCIYGNCIETIECEIYNRWGEKVFTINEKTQCWNGKLDGVVQNTGIFVYQAKVGLRNGENKSIKGNFTLVR